MKDKNTDLWESKASQALKLKPRKWLGYYLGKSYLRVTQIGLSHKAGEPLNLLKTDLWNEGIRTERTILGEYQENKQLNTYGIDISRLTCLLAREKNEKINIFQGSIGSLPFESGFFDIILDLSTLDHIPESEVSGVIQEYQRVLKKGAILVLVFWYPSLLQRLVSRLGKACGQPEDPLQYYLPTNSVKNEVKRDFDILEEFCLGTLLNIHNRVTDPVFEILPEFIYNLILKTEYSTVSKCFFKGFAGLYAIISRKR